MSEGSEIDGAIGAYPRKLRDRLQELRRLIHDVAAATPGVGPLEEALKWGQPSFLTTASKSGTTVRIDRLSKTDHRPTLFVSCQTDLIETFKAIYPETFDYQGKRAIILDADGPLQEDALRHCIGLALTHKARRTSRVKRGV